MSLVNLRHCTIVGQGYPIGSMYGIFPYIYHKNQLNVGIYTIHGSYGTWIPCHLMVDLLVWYVFTAAHVKEAAKSVANAQMNSIDDKKTCGTSSSNDRNATGLLFASRMGLCMMRTIRLKHMRKPSNAFSALIVHCFSSTFVIHVLQFIDFWSYLF